jgi:hypothetical protein
VPTTDYGDEWAPAGKLTAERARAWLCDKLDLDYAKLVEEDLMNAAEGFEGTEAGVAGLDPKAVPMTLKEWLARHLPEPEYILGRVITTTSRALVVAPTGVGKSMLLIALGMAIAAERGFLHRAAVKPAKVLYIDGEMSNRLLKRRLREELHRLGVEPPDTFFALSHEDIPNFAPLNTPQGRAAIEVLLKQIGKVDLIIFDNIMSLVAGDQKDEEGWRLVMDWVKKLTARSIGQIWVHHTGHDESKSYGTKTREWGMDLVVHLTKVERADTDVSFDLEFKKARERTPETRAEFAKVRVALVMDQWTVEAAPTSSSPSFRKLKPDEATMLTILSEAGEAGLPLGEWNKQARAAGVGLGRRARLYDLRTSLLKQELIREENEHWFVGGKRTTTYEHPGDVTF